MTERNQLDPADERAQGRAMLASILFFAVTGAGIGVFYEAGGVGAVIGAALGIGFGFWLAPRMVAERNG